MPTRRSSSPLASRLSLAALALITLLAGCATSPTLPRSNDYQGLVDLFGEWRAFENPPLRDGAPDYTTVRMARAHAEWRGYRDRLQAIDVSGWPVAQQVDWHIMRAELNGFDFNCRVLQPWARDPAFYQQIWTYQSDTPAHEGPSNHALVELWTYDFPLVGDDEARLVRELATVPNLLQQARQNLTGNARDLWVAGMRTMRQQVTALRVLGGQVGGSASDELQAAIRSARLATQQFVAWLGEQADDKTGPSGIGKANYTWYLQNVHLVPLTWEDEMRLLQRELDRAWSNLRLEEHRNRDLPELVAANTPAEYAALADAAATRLMTFVGDQDVLDVQPNMEPALREHLGTFVPEGQRNFFWIAAHFDPVPLYTHFYHWWDLARMRDEPHSSPMRRGPLLYNIFDSRAEGLATGVEEMFLHAGLYDEQPRSREIVWIMLAQRAARGIGSLLAHANELTMAEAGAIHVDWTPRGWMKREPDLMRFEQHLYLRQPGYGTSYITGKYLIERLMAAYAQQGDARGEPFVLKDFFAELNSCGVIPVSLIQWQLTGTAVGDGAF
ncbi:MAG: hypothetical protein ACI9S9_002939 [Planctomycetota bacterium]|jgi:hypothetical protein